jgi:hypothetical protein
MKQVSGRLLRMQCQKVRKGMRELFVSVHAFAPNFHAARCACDGGLYAHGGRKLQLGWFVTRCRLSADFGRWTGQQFPHRWEEMAGSFSWAAIAVSGLRFAPLATKIREHDQAAHAHAGDEPSAGPI